MGEAEAVLQALHVIWRDWSAARRPFRNEPEMQCEMRRMLLQELRTCGSRLDIALEYTPPKIREIGGGQSTRAWTRYDIAVVAGEGESERPVALIELSYGDTNVKHALHNGELKLLGDCRGRREGNGVSYAGAKRIRQETIEQVQRALAGIPVRGLFFVNPGARRALGVRRSAVWEVADDRFLSALWSAEAMRRSRDVTLEEVFSALSKAGLWCWYYATTAREKPLELPPGS